MFPISKWAKHRRRRRLPQPDRWWPILLYTVCYKLLLVHLRYDRHDIFDVGREAPPRRTSRFRQENKNKLISPERRWQVELETNLREVWSFTITSWLKAPTTMGWCLFSVYHSDDRFLNVEPVVATFNLWLWNSKLSGGLFPALVARLRRGRRQWMDDIFRKRTILSLSSTPRWPHIMIAKYSWFLQLK